MLVFGSVYILYTVSSWRSLSEGDGDDDSDEDIDIGLEVREQLDYGDL